MRQLLLVVLLLSAACHAAVDVGVDSILRPEPWGYMRLDTPLVLIRNAGADTVNFRAWFRVVDAFGVVRSFDSLDIVGLPPVSDSVLRFPPTGLWGPVGAWLARCSTWVAADSDPSNDTLSLVFRLTVG